jgi:hypothetical protein
MELKGKLNYDDVRAAVWLQIKPRPVYAVVGVLLICLCAFVAFDLVRHWSSKSQLATI